MLFHCKVSPCIKFAGIHLYTRVERGTVRVTNQLKSLPWRALSVSTSHRFSSSKCFSSDSDVLLPDFKYPVKSRGVRYKSFRRGVPLEICPGLNVNEIQIRYADKHHKVCSLVKSQQNTHNSFKYEVI